MLVIKVSTLFLFLCACAGSLAQSEIKEVLGGGDQPLIRQKRTLFLKKKILGAGAVGLGLGIGIGAIKGYKVGYHNAPRAIVERPVYIEKPYYVNRPFHYPNPGNGNYYTGSGSWSNSGSFGDPVSTGIPSYSPNYNHGYYY